MKKFLAMVMAMVTLVAFSTSAFAIGILPYDAENGEVVVSEKPVEEVGAIRQIDPRAVLVGNPENVNLVKNEAMEDTGKIWLSWGGTAKATYGCTTANISYTNPEDSNIGVTFKMVMLDSEMIKNFGTTLKTPEETLELACKGLDILQSGKLSEEEIEKYLASVRFSSIQSFKEFMSLDYYKVLEMDEFDRLKLAQLAGYSPASSYVELSVESGIIYPAYALYQIDLYTLLGRYTLPKGSYNVTYVLNGYDASRNKMSDFMFTLPATLEVEQDLPVEYQEQYGIQLLNRIGG